MARLLSDWFLQSGTPRHLVVPAPRPHPASWLIPAHYLFSYLTWVSLDAHGAICLYSGPLSVALMAQRACAPVYSVSDVFRPCLFLPPRHLCSTQLGPQPRHDSILICVYSTPPVPSRPRSHFTGAIRPDQLLWCHTSVWPMPNLLCIQPSQPSSAGTSSSWLDLSTSATVPGVTPPSRCALPACVFGSPSSPPWGRGVCHQPTSA